MNNEATNPPDPAGRSPEARWEPVLEGLADRWQQPGTPVPSPLPDWLLHKLRARLERGDSGGDGIADALPAGDSPPAQVVPALDQMEFEALASILEDGLLDRRALAAVHATFSEARAELAEREPEAAALARALAARDRQLSVATHELRTPISSILLNLQILERTARSQQAMESDAVLKLLAVPSRQLRRLTRMVDLLLDSAQVENERLELDLQPLDLCELVHDVASRLQEVAQAARCELDLSECHPARGEWDRLRLEQVVSNLLTNAIKYGGGKVEVRTHQPSEACIVVRDFGRGIAADDQERIFEPFERVHSGGGEEGAGLGLYIVREIVRAHGGRIALESRPGEGAAFSIYLPVSPPGAQAR